MAWFSLYKERSSAAGRALESSRQKSRKKFSAAYIAGCPGRPEAFDLSLFDQRSQHGLHSRGAYIGEQCAQIFLESGVGLLMTAASMPAAAQKRIIKASHVIRSVSAYHYKR